MSFQQDLIDSGKVNTAYKHALEDYCPPHGSHDAEIKHLLHWHPKYPGSKPYGQFDFDLSPTLKFIEKVFPGARKHHFFVDLWCKKTESQDSEGNWKKDEDIYELKRSPGELKLHKKHALSQLEACSGTINFVWGVPAHKSVDEEHNLGIDKKSGWSKYQIYTREDLKVSLKHLKSLSSSLTMFRMFTLCCRILPGLMFSGAKTASNAASKCSKKPKLITISKSTLMRLRT